KPGAVGGRDDAWSTTHGAQQGAADDVPLDFRSAFPDALDAGVTPDALQRKVVHKAHAAVNLDCLVGNEGENLGGLELGHGHVLVGDGTLVVFPACLEHQKVRGLELGGHVGKLERYA